MNAHHHIIAIGATKANIDEIASFFNQKPLAGVAYVIVQYLPPDFRTRLAEILARHLHLAVREAQNGVLVETDHVYITPDDKYMIIDKGRLYITEKAHSLGLRRNTDIFFSSLAADQGQKAIGVVLFEIKEDDLGWIGAIRSAGGIIIARKQETVCLPSTTDCADFFAEPGLMPQIIEDYVMQNRKTLLDQNEKVTMEMIFNVIRENTAFDFSGYRFDMLSHKTRKRALDQNFYSLADYLSFLKVTIAEMHALSREFLTGGTTLSRSESTSDSLRATIAKGTWRIENHKPEFNEELTHNEHLPDLEKKLNELKTSLSEVRRQSDVTIIDLRVANALLRLANGRLRHDNKEMRSANQELDVKYKKLIEVNEELDNFVHLASHDLLAPLAHIEGSISLINEIGVDDTHLTEVLDIIGASIKRFRTLVEDIGTIAKVEHDLKSREQVDINEVIQSVLWPLEAKIQQSKTQITVDLQERSISFSKKNLRSIVFNLVSNSLKFNQSLHPTIHISTEKSGGQLIVSVKDNGLGIATTELDHIFSLYGRVRNDIEGNGIGLYLIKRIIDASGGRLVVESIPGEGSKFSIYFAAN